MLARSTASSAGASGALGAVPSGSVRWVSASGNRLAPLIDLREQVVSVDGAEPCRGFRAD